MTTQVDYYELLGVSRTADDATIKSAFRKLAIQCHPDKHGGCKEQEAKFKAINEAYDCLKDPQKRAAYDRFGHAGPQGMGGGGAGPGFDAFSDIFESMFGEFMGGGRRGGGGRQTPQGADLRYNLEISLEEAARGAEKTIRIPTQERCDTCGGSGAKAGTQAKPCPTCGGAGQVRIQQGFFSIQQTCPKCHGSGSYIPDPCSTCHGAGRVKKQKTLEVKIPAGIDEGMRLRHGGHGEPGINGGPSGDLYVEIHIKPHAVFQREGDDLHCEMPISFATAALGGDIEIPTLDGMARIKVPAETQTGKVFRLRGKGIRNVRSHIQGDLMCHVLVETPVKLTDRQRELLEEFQRIGSENADRQNPKAKSWMDKVKDFFQ